MQCRRRRRREPAGAGPALLRTVHPFLQALPIQDLPIHGLLQRSHWRDPGAGGGGCGGSGPPLFAAQKGLKATAWLPLIQTWLHLIQNGDPVPGLRRRVPKALFTLPELSAQGREAGGQRDGEIVTAAPAAPMAEAPRPTAHPSEATREQAGAADAPGGGPAAGPTDPAGISTALEQLVAVVARLRDPEGGCPWDLEQTHASLIPYVLEEAHELADAIRHGDDGHLREELGDLLLQVVLQAQIASEEGRFDLGGVAAAIRDKLIRRHPHVFGDAVASDSAAVRRSWEAIKARERADRQDRSGEGLEASASPLSDRLAESVRGQPALAGAMTISRKAAAAGFEWDDMAGVWQKVHEELDELKEAVASGDRAHAQEELGDVLFTLVNVARWCGLDPEEGLAGTNRRFLDRFSRVEAALGGDLSGQNLAALETHWRAAKAALRAEQAARKAAAGQPSAAPGGSPA